ncbi:tetratricopeptide repeat protein 36 [Venturia canescens]|uniref:tetratricopeptide repeat protein 36 n=1 Tax=Venturia canescens TaxID=32260 RepID=UPI001C9CB796|nr:tetratricopeptide repeat protein 36 [Venturia canescens]
MERLSEHDKAVLDVIFDPLKLMGSSFTSQQDQVDSSSFKDIELPVEVANILDCAIEASKNQRFEESLRFFDEAKTKVPQSAAILNDRAQALRLLGRDDEALEDLNLSLGLSKGCGKPGIQALCQRGILHRCAGRLDEARQDFETAARAGSSFARTQLVNLNPYAAMCNAMLRDINAKSATPMN